ncbi:MAG TPA: AAA family ATPase [Kofleriaceae bacterium]|nr:AAA family ATPase [Kofleriaceae bacterium]
MPALVGRSRELAAIDDALARVRGGGFAVVLVGGEPGIGKTRLLDELAARALGSAAIAVWGRTWELGGAPAFWPWIEALRALAQADPSASAARDAAEILVGARAADPGERFALWGDVAATLRAAAARRPLVLLFDDLHAADPSSIGLLELVVRGAPPGLLVAATFRDSEARAQPELEAALGRIGRRGAVLAPARLDRDQVAALAGWSDASAIDRLVDHSDGNPLFVLELAAAGAAGVPRGARAAIGDRLDRLSRETRRVLEAAAIAGRDIDASLVAAVVGGSVREVLDRIGEAVRAGLVAEMSGERPRFTHAVVAETLAGELDGAKRAELHLEVARVLETRHAGDAAPPHAAIAHHLLEAGHLAAALAVDAAARAAEAAMHALAFEDAAALIERALAALALAAPGDAARRASLTCALAEALHRAGSHERGRAAAAQAASLARALSSPPLLARAALANGIEVHLGLVDRAQVALLEEALAAQPDDARAIRAVLMARLASAQQPSADPRSPVELARAAIAIAREEGDRALRLRVITSAMGAITDYVPPAERIACNREIVELATAPPDRVHARRALVRLTFDHLELGDRVAAEEAIAAHRALGDGAPSAHALMLDAAIALLEGRDADDARLSDEALALANTRGDVGALRSITVHRLIAAILRGPVTADNADFERIMREAPAIVRVGVRAWIAGARGDREASRAALALLEAGELAPALFDSQLAVMLASAVVTAGDRARARMLYDALAHHAGTAAIASVLGFAVIDLFDRVLAELAVVRGDLGADVIERHRASARALAQRLATPRWIAHAPSDAIRFAREGDVWAIEGQGERARVKDSRGMHMIAALVAQPGREVHALELSGASETDGGDAGELLDDDARAAYRERLAELTAEIDQAEAWGDRGRAERARREADALRDELARAVGIGGKIRRSGSAAERARSNVTRRIRAAIEHIAESCPRIGAHLSRSIRTGTFCSYEPR